jgi:hypothetical protein
MNLNICKEKCCLKQSKISFHKSIDNTDFTIGMFISDKNNTSYKRCNFAFFNKKKTIKDVLGRNNTYIAKFMEINKKCPYYIEHLIYDLNKKNK